MTTKSGSQSKTKSRRPVRESENESDRRSRKEKDRKGRMRTPTQMEPPRKAITTTMQLPWS